MVMSLGRTAVFEFHQGAAGEGSVPGGVGLGTGGCLLHRRPGAARSVQPQDRADKNGGAGQRNIRPGGVGQDHIDPRFQRV